MSELRNPSDEFQQDPTRCFFCSRPAVHKHHILEGSRRQTSERLGLVVYLCLDHHTGKWGIHYNEKMNQTLKATAQQWWERQPGHNHSKWMKEVGKNYERN